MARRFFLSPVIGTGTIADPYRLKSNGANLSALIPSNSDGSPKFAYGLMLASAGNLATLLADVTLSSFPDLAMTDTVTALQATQVNTAVLSRLGLTVNVVAGDTFSEALGKVVAAIDPACDLSKMAVSG